MKRTNLLSFLPFLVLLLLPHLGSKPILASEDVHSLLLYHNKYFISHSKHFSINHAFQCLMCMWFQVSSYVVYFGSHSHVGVITQDAMDRVRETHYDFLGSFTGRSFEQPTILLLFIFILHLIDVSLDFCGKQPWDCHRCHFLLIHKAHQRLCRSSRPRPSISYLQ